MKLRHHLLHHRPRRIVARLTALREAGVIDDEPSLWQLWLGVLYMWNRVFFRPETVGLSSAPIRPTARARWFAARPLRSPWLFLGRRVNPLDHTGLASSTEHVVRHLLGAHHDRQDFLYDLQLFAHEPGALQDLRDRVASIVDGTAPDAEFLKDLCVYEGYHEALLAGIDAWLDGEVTLDHDDPDATLTGLLAWCRRQPDGARATIRALVMNELHFGPPT
jgi:hypothetical protein